MKAKRYIVGGAVRDKLLGLEVKDRDWVVVGVKPEDLLAEGFQPVGKDFPVFLHPKTKEEHALARTERKHGQGYKGFVFYAQPDVSLEEDLRRRDLTINAMATDENGHLIDPYGGQNDLNNRVLRHTSPAFTEDPLRILRAARFLARFHSLGFRLAEETETLLKQMTAGDELITLSAERVWRETEQALKTDSPWIFFTALQEVGGLDAWYPEIAALFGVPQPEKWHPEVDCGLHTMMVLEQAAKLSERTTVRFAALCHDLGKGITPKDILPSHHGHEERGVRLAEKLCERLRVPTEMRDLAMLSCRYHTHCHKVNELRDATLLKLFESFDLWRRPNRIKEFAMVAKADALGIGGRSADFVYGKDEILLKTAEKLRQFSVTEIARQGDKKTIAKRIRAARLEYLKEVRESIRQETAD